MSLRKAYRRVRWMDYSPVDYSRNPLVDRFVGKKPWPLSSEYGTYKTVKALAFSLKSPKQSFPLLAEKP